jgi:outer membrane protein OmpA-like peptidoglycan-associated protein
MLRLVLALFLLGVSGGQSAMAQAACAGVVPADPNYQQYTVLFAVGSSSLTGQSRTAITQAANQIKAQFKNQVCLIGRTSPTGSREANERLAAARIRSVTDALVGQGVQRGIIEGLVQGPAFGMRRDRAENPEDRSVMIMFPR